MEILLEDILTQQKLPPPPSNSYEQGENCRCTGTHRQIACQGSLVKSHRGEPGKFISNAFLCPKKDGGFRMILNLKKFNEYVQYQHFKMEALFDKQYIPRMLYGHHRL